MQISFTILNGKKAVEKGVIHLEKEFSKKQGPLLYSLNNGDFSKDTDLGKVNDGVYHLSIKLKDETLLDNMPMYCKEGSLLIVKVE